MRISEIINESVLTELSRPSMRTATNMLDKAGYVNTGYGVNAEVFVKPGANHVLKLFGKRDQAYRQFVNMTLQNPNTHFPKFKGKMMRVTPDYYAIRMEYLTPLPNNDKGMLNTLRRYIYKQIDTSGPSVSTEEMNQIEIQQPGTIDACNLLAGFINTNNLVLDLHAGNAMMRGNTLVIIDPVV